MKVRGSLIESGEAREEARDEPDEVLKGVLRQRERHQERSAFVRVGVVVAGGTIVLFGALLSFAPEFGLPLLLLGLRLLALEFDWAARAYARVSRVARRVGGRLRKLLPRSRRGVALAAVVAAPAVALLLGVVLR